MKKVIEWIEETKDQVIQDPDGWERELDLYLGDLVTKQGFIRLLSSVVIEMNFERLVEWERKK